MIKTQQLDLVVNCEDCEELNVEGSCVTATVPLKDTRAGVKYDLEFTVTERHNEKKIELDGLYNPDDENCLETLAPGPRKRLKSLLSRIKDGNVCGNLSQCPRNIKKMAP
ncbi:MAG: hypothetical protein ABEK50_14135 [bacterium]